MPARTRKAPTGPRRTATQSARRYNGPDPLTAEEDGIEVLDCAALRYWVGEGLPPDTWARTKFWPDDEAVATPPPDVGEAATPAQAGQPARQPLRAYSREQCAAEAEAWAANKACPSRAGPVASRTQPPMGRTRAAGRRARAAPAPTSAPAPRRQSPPARRCGRTPEWWPS